MIFNNTGLVITSLPLKILKYLGIYLLCSLFIYNHSIYAAQSSKMNKLKSVIKQQQDTIDLLKLKLKRCGQGDMMIQSYIEPSKVISPTTKTDLRPIKYQPKVYQEISFP